MTDAERSIIGDVKIQLPKGRLSPSQIEMYLRCPRQYEFRYVEGKSSPPAVALIEGGAHHKALEANNLQKIKKGTDMKPKAIFSAFADVFSTKKKEIEDWEGETADSVLGRGRVMLEEYVKTFATQFIPVASEREVMGKVGPVEVMGIIDAVGGVRAGKTLRPSIVDYKTVSRRKSDAELKGSVQLSFYSAVEAESGDCGFDVGYVNLVKSGHVDPQFVPFDMARVRWFRAITLHVAAAISRGSFPVTSPDSWCCSERFCGFYSQCRGAFLSGKGVKK